jgi:hypothetical protein
MGGVWVPWRLGSPTQQAAARRAGGRAVKGQVSDKAAISKARKKHRQEALKLLRKGKITPAEYHKRLRKIG